MTSESVHSRTADPDLYLPVDGLSLLGEQQGSGYAGHRFLVRRGDGQVIQLPLLLYLIMAAVAEGSVDGGWSADQVSARVGAASGRGLAADNVRYLIASKLAPLGLIGANGAGGSDAAPGAAQLPRVNLLSGLKIRRQRWALMLGGTAVLVSVAAAAPIMAGTGNREAAGTRSASASAPASFGSGATRVAVRAIAPDGAAAFKAQLATEMTALASAGRQLLGNKDIRAAPSAQAALRAGRVDARLLAILALLAAQQPIRLVRFTSAPGAGPGALLRAAEISVASAASRSAVLSLLEAQQSPYRPAVAVGGGSPALIALQFDAPASLSMSQP